MIGSSGRTVLFGSEPRFDKIIEYSDGEIDPMDKEWPPPPIWVNTVEKSITEWVNNAQTVFAILDEDESQWPTAWSRKVLREMRIYKNELFRRV